jgi:hypothetical protein
MGGSLEGNGACQRAKSEVISVQMRRLAVSGTDALHDGCNFPAALLVAQVVRLPKSSSKHTLEPDQTTYELLTTGMLT